MVFIDFFTEGESEKIVLNAILPQLIPDKTFRVISFEGKTDLKKRLPRKLRAYRTPPLNSHKIIILVDKDREDCHRTKRELEEIVERAGLRSKTISPNNYQVITRVTIEELEAWYFGDVLALQTAYPSIPETLGQKRKYSIPDAISKPSQQLLSLLKSEYGNIQRLPKLDVASKISEHMKWDANTSESFRSFYSGILDILSREI